MLTGQTYRQPLHVIFQQDLSRTYPTHHELESVIIKIIIIVIIPEGRMEDVMLA